MLEFGGLWKLHNNPACTKTKSVRLRVFRMCGLHHLEERAELYVTLIHYVCVDKDLDLYIAGSSTDQYHIG